MAGIDSHSYIWRMLEMESNNAILICSECLKISKETGSVLSPQCQEMKQFVKTRSLHLVCMSNRFHKEIPLDELDSDSHRSLGKEYEDLYDELTEESNSQPMGQVLDQRVVPIDTELLQVQSNIEDHRKTRNQIRKHLFAFFLLFEAAKKNEDLTEGIIKHAHRLLIHNLCHADCTRVRAGEYREISVHTGNYTYLAHEQVPEAMKEFISFYNQQAAVINHDPYYLAAWVLHTFLNIHPFEDGNGRIARLLWCFSLIRDGIPFPLTPFPGKRKAYSQYIKCIEKDQSGLTANCKHLTNLTLGSVAKTWENFLSQLPKEKHTIVKRRVVEAGFSDD